MKQYNVVDLFAGAGGLSLGFSQTGRFSIVAAAENNPNARKTYKKNHKNTRLYSDVRSIDYKEILDSFGSIDVVIGGPPCQGFSNANRQHSTIISMNNCLVKEYVRAICELKPTAFVMENVKMLQSNVHRFIVDEEDLKNDIVMELDLSNDNIELLPSGIDIPNIIDFIKDENSSVHFSWDEKFYKVIGILYRYRINQEKFDKTLNKYNAFLISVFTKYSSIEITNDTPAITIYDYKMSNAMLNYISNKSTAFNEVIKIIDDSFSIQKMLKKISELRSNNIHIFDYIQKLDGSIAVEVRSYSVLDYLHKTLEAGEDGYKLTPMTLNAVDYGAPQKRERFIMIGISKSINKDYKPPKPKIKDGNYYKVRDAIEDLENIPVSFETDAAAVKLQSQPKISGLGKKLRGKLLYNHISTSTRSTAMERFKALKEGQNFHDLSADLKTTYSNSERTQNTIYMRLKYDEPCGTVVNVRKSMWVHPTLDRAISIREAARLQTFPDSFVFEGTKDAQYQQVGNAVPPFLSKAVAKSILKVLDD